MLWKFYRNSEDACHYVFGTIHLSTDLAYTHCDLAIKYLARVGHFVSEMDLDVGTRSPELIACFQLPSQMILSTYFSERKYRKYRKLVLKTFEVDLDDYESYCPFYVLNIISIIGLMREQNPNDRQVLDHELHYIAQSNGKTIEGIESVDDQINIAKSIPMDYQVKAFKKAMRNITAFKNSSKTLVQLYARGDTKSLYKISKKGLGQIRSLMLYDRNSFFVERIEEITIAQPSFFAVGAAHLPGDKGVLALLKKKGYKVKKVLE